MRQTTEHETHSSHTEEKRYFNEYVQGLGYLNSIRDIGSEKKVCFAAQVSALQGASEHVEYVYHDLMVTSERVLKVIMDHRQAIENDDANVLVHFKMTNPRPKPFIYKQGERAGELGATIGGFLTRIVSMKVNGELVYEDKQDNDFVDDQNANGMQ
mgnify:FL=1